MSKAVPKPMFMRISHSSRGSVGAFAIVVAAGLMLSACGGGGSDNAADPLDVAESAAERRAANDGRIECASGAEAALTRACLVERSESEKGLVLTIHHPNGHFRRLLVTKDGRGVIAADGAEQATVAIVADGEIEVTVANDRYRLPATVKGEQKDAQAGS